MSITITHVEPDSLGWKHGLRRGDSVVTVDDAPIADDLDFGFSVAVDECVIRFRRKNALRTVRLQRNSGDFIGVTFAPRKPRRCRNRCVFCFIDQMPRGLRKSLYVKDEDYLYSFLHGNYITLENETGDDLERIVDQGLSPLYVSVHATDQRVRAALLGNPKAPPIRARLARLGRRGIVFHTQIVVCPGINDGATLDKTVNDLLNAGDYIRSIAVVPVGLTRFRKKPLQPVTREDALRMCERLGPVSDRDCAANGCRRLFMADELFLKAGLPIPPRRYYEDYPQIENGVGLIRMLREDWRTVKRAWRTAPERLGAPKKISLITGVSAAGCLQKIADEIAAIRPEIAIDLRAVSNDFFGRSVTVAGLLTARDVIRVAREDAHSHDAIILPAAMFNYAGVTLDGFSLARIERILGAPVISAGSITDLLPLFDRRNNARTA